LVRVRSPIAAPFAPTRALSLARRSMMPAHHSLTHSLTHSLARSLARLAIMPVHLRWLTRSCNWGTTHSFRRRLRRLPMRVEDRAHPRRGCALRPGRRPRVRRQHSRGSVPTGIGRGGLAVALHAGPGGEQLRVPRLDGAAERPADGAGSRHVPERLQLRRPHPLRQALPRESLEF